MVVRSLQKSGALASCIRNRRRALDGAFENINRTSVLPKTFTSSLFQLLVLLNQAPALPQHIVYVIQYIFLFRLLPSSTIVASKNCHYKKLLENLRTYFKAFHDPTGGFDWIRDLESENYTMTGIRKNTPVFHSPSLISFWLSFPYSSQSGQGQQVRLVKYQ